MIGWLGYGGLIPFVSFAALAWTDRAHALAWHQNLKVYGVVILSFVGAVHWGLAMAPGEIAVRQRNAMFIWSVVPSLMAFLALAVHAVIGDVLLMSGFLLHYAMDLRVANRAALPAWYLPLRLRLSIIAMACLTAGALATFA